MLPWKQYCVWVTNGKHAPTVLQSLPTRGYSWIPLFQLHKMCTPFYNQPIYKLRRIEMILGHQMYNRRIDISKNGFVPVRKCIRLISGHQSEVSLHISLNWNHISWSQLLQMLHSARTRNRTWNQYTFARYMLIKRSKNAYFTQMVYLKLLTENNLFQPNISINSCHHRNS